MKNLYAHTETTGPVPGYISINEQDDGTVSVSVRTRGANAPGHMTLTSDEYADLVAKLSPKAPAKAK